LPGILLDGGVFTGQTQDDSRKGVDTECRGLTLLPELGDRELLGFMRPGTDRRSYSGCFLSALAPPRPETMTTAVRGEPRPCVACGACENVCPAGIMPYAIHKQLYQGALEEAERLRLDLCIDCGLCSYVCPAKIELGTEFKNAKVTIREELHPAEEASE